MRRGTFSCPATNRVFFFFLFIFPHWNSNHRFFPLSLKRRCILPYYELINLESYGGLRTKVSNRNGKTELSGKSWERAISCSGIIQADDDDKKANLCPHITCFPDVYHESCLIALKSHHI